MQEEISSPESDVASEASSMKPRSQCEFWHPTLASHGPLCRKHFRHWRWCHHASNYANAWSRIYTTHTRMSFVAKLQRINAFHYTSDAPNSGRALWNELITLSDSDADIGICPQKIPKPKEKAKISCGVNWGLSWYSIWSNKPPTGIHCVGNCDERQYRFDNKIFSPPQVLPVSQSVSPPFLRQRQIQGMFDKWTIAAGTRKNVYLN